MNRNKKNILLFLKGFIIGGGAIIPGLSGGTVAIVCGEFENILYETTNIFKTFNKSFRYLFCVFAGAVLGILGFSHLISIFSEEFPLLSKITFCGISFCGAAIFLFKKINLTFHKEKTNCLIGGVISAILFSYFLEKFEVHFLKLNTLSLFIIGIALSIALILPAMSFSYMLLFFGIYDQTLTAIKNYDFTFIFPIAFGVAVGILIFSKLLLNLLKRHEQNTYSFVFGFVILTIFDLLTQ